MARFTPIIALICACSATPALAENINVFGGEKYDVFLGCLNCDEFDQKSIANKFGEYGSEFSQTSILDTFSEYGSKFSSTSACDEFALKPPKVIGVDGRYYGVLSVNEFIADQNSALLKIARMLCAKALATP